MIDREEGMGDRGEDMQQITTRGGHCEPLFEPDYLLEFILVVLVCTLSMIPLHSGTGLNESFCNLRDLTCTPTPLSFSRVHIQTPTDGGHLS